MIHLHQGGVQPGTLRPKLTRATRLILDRWARVPRFFFHLYDDMVVRDEEGIELSDLASARKKAVENAREIACAEVLEGHLNLKHRIEVEDESGAVHLTVRFADVVRLDS